MKPSPCHVEDGKRWYSREQFLEMLDVVVQIREYVFRFRERCMNSGMSLFRFGNTVVRICHRCSDRSLLLGFVIDVRIDLAVVRIRHRCPARVAVVRVGNVDRIVPPVGSSGRRAQVGCRRNTECTV